MNGYDLFTWQDGDGRGIYGCTIYIIKDEFNENDPKWNLRGRNDVDDMRVLFHDVNRVDIRVGHAEGNKLAVTLDAFGKYNYTPNFKEYQVKIDDGQWKAEGASFTWRLNKGHNELTAKAVNKFGVGGHASRIVFDLPGKSGPKVKIVDDEKRAANLLSVASMALRSGQKAAAGSFFAKIQKDYPDTDAARKAKRLMQKHYGND